MSEQGEDIRWRQRFSNFEKALRQLEKYVDQEEMNELEEQGLIKAFEYTYELAWKTLQDLIKEKGYLDIVGPRPVIEQSFQDGCIADGEAWMRMLDSRNMTSHTYIQETAKDIVAKIRLEYRRLLHDLAVKLKEEDN